MSSTGRLSADWRPRMPARKVEGRKRRRIWAVGLVLVGAAVFGAVLLELCARRLLPIELRFTRNQRGRLPRSLPDNSFPLRASQARFAFARSAHSRHRCPPSGCAVTGCGPAAHGRRAGASSQREVATQSRCASFGSHGCFCFRRKSSEPWGKPRSIVMAALRNFLPSMRFAVALPR